MKAEKEYIKSLDSREKNLSWREKEVNRREDAVYRDRKDLDELVNNKADEKVQNITEKYERLIADEDNKIQTLAERQVAQYKLELNDRHRKHESELERKYAEKNEKLDKDIEAHNRQYEQECKKLSEKKALIIAKNSIIGANCIIFALIGGIMGVYSSIIAFCHGLLPIISADGKEVLGWIANNWHLMCSTPFGIGNVLSGLRLFMPLITVAIIVIWATRDFPERKWMLFADKLSLAVLCVAISISAIGGKWLSAAGINTLVIPIIIWVIYFLIRCGVIVFILGSIADKVGGAFKGLIDHLKSLKSNEVAGYLIMILVILFVVLQIKSWIGR